MLAHIVWIGKGKQINVPQFSDSEWLAEQAECAKNCPDSCFTDYIDLDETSVEYCFALCFDSELFKWQACIVYHGEDDYLFVNNFDADFDEYSYVAIRDMAIKIQDASIELALYS